MAFEVTRASRTETKVLAEMLEGLFAEAPEMVDRCDDFSADRGLDNAPQKKQLWDKWTIRPLIDTRLMWKAEKEEPGYDPERPITRPLFPERADVIVHDERGRVSCICPETGEVRAMAFQGFEAVFQHASIQSLLRELGRNPALLEALRVRGAGVPGRAPDGASRRHAGTAMRGDASGAGALDGAEPLELLALPDRRGAA